MSASRAENFAGIGALLGSVAGDLQELLRGELRLVRAEFDQKLGALRRIARGARDGTDRITC